MPLWFIAGVCSLIALVVKKRFTYHHAACLSRSLEIAQLTQGNLYSSPYQDAAMSAQAMGTNLPQFDQLKETLRIEENLPEFIGKFERTLNPLL